MGVPVIEFRGVSKIYGAGEGAVAALRAVDLAIAPGEFVALMGPSGSGKSTAMNIMGALDVPSAGSYCFAGTPLESLTRDERALLRRQYLGFVFQGFNLLARTSALENVELPLLYRRVAPRARRALALAALNTVGLADWAAHTPAELSGGQQQRVAIARAIVCSPQVLLADEPTGNLDSQRSHSIMALLASLNHTQGLTIVMVTHELEMTAYASRLITFRDGQISPAPEGVTP
jgi:putative ABC transport system ATP-binding protein